jgi:hypothetical protein
MISPKNIIITRLSALLVLACLFVLPAHKGNQLSAQTVALRTNALLWGAEAANVSVDLTVSESSTIGITAAISVHDSWIHNTNAKGGQVEYRYWFSHQPFHRLFVGPIGGIFHYTIDDDTDTQTCVPAGINAGYAWTLSNHWNVEACYGVGYLYYNRASRDANDVITKSNHHLFTTVNFGLNISYVF